MIEELKQKIISNKSLSILNHYDITNYNKQNNDGKTKMTSIEFKLKDNIDFLDIFKRSVDQKFGGTLAEFIQNDFKDLVRSDLMSTIFKKNYQITSFICDIKKSTKSVDEFIVYINYVERAG